MTYFAFYCLAGSALFLARAAAKMTCDDEKVERGVCLAGAALFTGLALTIAIF